MADHEGDIEPNAPAPGGGGGSTGRLVLRVVLVLALCGVAVEIAAQAFSWITFTRFEKSKLDPGHFFRSSENEVLAYELAPGASVQHDDRSLHINVHGIRDDEDGVFPDRIKVALLGASVVFGHTFGLEDTIGALLQDMLDPSRGRIRVLNFAVPGYGMEEHLENLKVKDAVYDVDYVVFILNAVDFAERNTRYEGADNGLYRLYRRPRFASRYLLRKAIYRYHKGGPLWRARMQSVDWYEWMYRGTRPQSLARIRDMDGYCREQGCRFTLALLPAPSAYEGGRYQLADMYEEIFDFARESGIEAIQMIDAFGHDVASLSDKSDHLTLEGNRLLASILADALRPQLPPAPAS